MNEKDEWFPDVGEYLPENGTPSNPLDSMPKANGSNKYHPNGEPPSWEDTAPSEYEPPDDWFVENPDESDEIEEEKTMHQKMYEIATAKYDPFSVSGSDNFQGGSENRT